MKTIPSVFVLVGRALRKYKSKQPIMDDRQKRLEYKRDLLSSSSKLLLSLPEKKSDLFQKVIKELFTATFSSYYRDDAKSLIPYIDDLDFVANMVLQKECMSYYSKGMWIVGQRLYQYYDQMSRIDPQFDFVGPMAEWFETLSEDQQSEILLQRLNVASRYMSDAYYAYQAIIKYSNNPKVLESAAKKVEEFKGWHKLFVDKDYFDPDSEKGRSIEKIAQHLDPLFWVLHEVSVSDPEKEKPGWTADFRDSYVLFDIRVAQIEKYFGKIEIPEKEIRKMLAQALSKNDASEFRFYSRFIGVS